MKKLFALISMVLAAAVFFSNFAYAGVTFKNPITQEAYAYFGELLKIPRGSGNEKAVSDYLMAFAKENGLDAVQDKELNVLISKPGTKGREAEPPIILQGHMDMVCEKNEGVTHDFLKDPIIPVIDGDWIKAEGTTLGADNASGVSLIMAILASDKLQHPPVEALITTNEETDMSGAGNFNTSLLKGKRLINIDSEAEGVFTVSSASTTNATISVPVAYEDVPAGLSAYKLTVKGLLGGHSGLNINDGRANANILTARLLNTINDGSIRLSSINGGSAKNAIPRECSAVVLLPDSSAAKVKSSVAKAEKEFKVEYPFDKDMTLVFEKTDAPKSVMNAAAHKNVLAGILLTPNGVQAMSPQIEGLVRTSNNLGVVASDEKSVTLTYFARSSSLTEEDFLLERMKLAAASANAAISIDKQTPPWELIENSPLRDKMSAVYSEIYGKGPNIEALHAGLECAAFAKTLPGVDLISIGPDITGAHSPDEKMSLSSFDRVCGYVVKVLEKL